MPARTADRLRVLVLGRMFAGLKAGLAAGRWEPAGVPAICRLIEGLARDPEVDLLNVFTVKERDPRFAKAHRQTIAGIGGTVILPYRGWFGALRRGNAALTEIDSVARILALAARFRPHVVYATYANILPAALLARGGHRGVVLRLMGVVPHHREIAAGAHPMFRWFLHSPFAQVVCTEDGSDPAALLPKLLAPSTPWTVRLNGCDAKPMDAADIAAFRAAHSLGARPVAVFVGRFEQYKGSLDFVEAALAVLRAAPDAADFILVGDGPLRAAMQARVAAAGANAGARIRFVGSQPHAEVSRYLGASDIYISINLYGNLSNANLEALAAGACMVIPTSDPSLPLDTATDALIPADVALRYDRNRLPDSLTGALLTLLSAPEAIAERRRRAKILAQKLIKPWAQSAAEDIERLKQIGRLGLASELLSSRT